MPLQSVFFIIPIDMTMDAKQLTDYIIVPALTTLSHDGFDFCTKSRVKLLLGTAAVESDLGRYIHQVKGPALGIYQMEPATHQDIYDNFLKYRPKLREIVLQYYITKLKEANLISNLYYATMMAAIHYYRSPGKLPPHDNIELLANYWRDFYNTHLGAHTNVVACAKFVSKYNQYVRPYVH